MNAHCAEMIAILAKAQIDIEKFYDNGNRSAGFRARAQLRTLKRHICHVIKEMVQIDKRATEELRRFMAEEDQKEKLDDDSREMVA